MGGDESPWRTADAGLVARFHEAVAGLEGVDVRKMFGFPAVFIGGNMTAGVHPSADTFMVRLAEDERSERLADGWPPFEPMPGRTMPEYVALPLDVSGDARATRHWIERGAAYVRTLPPKAPKARKR